MEPPTVWTSLLIVVSLPGLRFSVMAPFVQELIKKVVVRGRHTGLYIRSARIKPMVTPSTVPEVVGKDNIGLLLYGKRTVWSTLKAPTPITSR